MALEVLIARWVAILWIVGGLSHLLQPGLWAKLALPLRERDTGGLLLAAFNLPLGLLVVLGHNVWVWDVPVIVTLAGWATTLKSVAYLLIPGAHVRALSLATRPERAFQVAGVVLILLGLLVGYDAFVRR